ncbi:Malate synthase [Bacillus cereus]|nr:Malate synthase [Bacillus cereus]
MSTQTSRVTLVGEMLPAYSEILTPEVLSFLKELHENFNERRIELLQNV